MKPLGLRTLSNVSVVRVAADAIEGALGEFDDVVFFGSDADAIEKAAIARRADG